MKTTHEFVWEPVAHPTCNGMWSHSQWYLVGGELHMTQTGDKGSNEGPVRLDILGSATRDDFNPRHWHQHGRLGITFNAPDIAHALRELGHDELAEEVERVSAHLRELAGNIT